MTDFDSGGGCQKTLFKGWKELPPFHNAKTAGDAVFF